MKDDGRFEGSIGKSSWIPVGTYNAMLAGSEARWHASAATLDLGLELSALHSTVLYIHLSLARLRSLGGDAAMQL